MEFEYDVTLKVTVGFESPDKGDLNNKPTGVEPYMISVELDGKEVDLPLGIHTEILEYAVERGA